MSVFLSGLLLFLGVHSVRMMAPQWRERVLQERGEVLWKSVYAVLSLAGFVLLCWGYGLARQQSQMLWLVPTGMRHVSALLILLGFVLLAAAYVPNNLLKSKLHHPMLLSVVLWSLGHLLVNARVVDIWLFAGFLVWSAVGFVLSRRRDALQNQGYPQGRVLPTAVTVVLGFVLGAVFAKFLHALFIGVAPFG